MKTASFESWPARDKAMAVLIVLFGVAVRLWALICGRSFWCDEAMLALNITHKGFRGLLKPLDWNQAAPVGFLWAERLVITPKSLVHLLGRTEIALRLIPFAGGVGCLILGAILARRYLGPLAGLTAVTLIACSDTLIYYSNELKQYESDAFIFLLLVAAMLRVHEARWSRGPVYALTALGAAGVYFSHIAVFAMGGFFLGSIVLEGPTEFVRNWKRWGATAVVWAVAFGVDYVCFLRPITHNPYLQGYWGAGYLPARIISADAVRWIVRTIYTNLAYAFGEEPGRFLAGLLLVCVMIGIPQLWRSRRPLAVFLWFPMLLAFLGALIHKFPFEGRLITFLVPGTFLTGAAAIDALPSRGIGWRIALAGGLCLLPLLSAVDRLTSRDRRQELRPVLQAIAPRVLPGDTFYVYSEAWAAYAYYDTIANPPGLHVVCGVDFGNDFSAYERDVEKLRGRGRVWFIATNFISFNGRDEEDLLLTPFARNGKKVERSDAFGAVAILYQM
jgi:hypothetical protein